MKFALKQLIKSAGFNYLAWQGMVLFTVLLAGCLVMILMSLFIGNSFITTGRFFNFWSICFFPFVLLYSLLSFLCSDIFKQQTPVSGKFFVILIFFLGGLLYLFSLNLTINIGNGGGLGLVILAVNCIRLGKYAILLFTLFPCVWLLYKGGKYNLSIYKAPFVKNEFYRVLIAGLYVIICVFYFYFSDRVLELLH